MRRRFLCFSGFASCRFRLLGGFLVGLTFRLVAVCCYCFWFYDDSDFGFGAWIYVVLVLCFWPFGYSGCCGDSGVCVYCVVLFVVCLARCVCFVGGFVALIRFRFACLRGWW